MFVNCCVEGRKMFIEVIEKVVEGCVWIGVMVKDFGLVDELGGIDKVLNVVVI